MSNRLSAEQVDGFREQGMLFPIDVITPDVAQSYLPKFELLRARMRPWCSAKQILKSHLVSTWVNELVREPCLLDAVEGLLGPDMLCWSATFFAKRPGDESFVGWHQDITYWGLEPADDVVTAWLALSDAQVDNGCMRVLPGSHRGTLRTHENKFGTANMLMSSQEVTLSHAEQDRVVYVPLEPGQASIHHSRLLHGSRSNPSSRPRVGLSINYIAAGVRQTTNGGYDSAMLVRGVDRYGHFDLEPDPVADFDEKAIEHYKKFIQTPSGVGRVGNQVDDKYINLDAISTGT